MVEERRRWRNNKVMGINGHSRGKLTCQETGKSIQKKETLATKRRIGGEGRNGLPSGAFEFVGFRFVVIRRFGRQTVESLD